MCFKVDHFPAVTVNDWPNIAYEWVIPGQIWPPLLLVKEIVTRGYQIVPKPCYDQKNNDLLDWR